MAGYIDTNGNGQYDEGEPVLIVATPLSEGGGGGSSTGSAGFISFWSPTGEDIIDSLDESTEPDTGGGAEYDPDEVDSDVNAIEVVVNINRPLSGEEIVALEALRDSIIRVNNAISALADNEMITLPNGSQVTGRELKEIWSKTDFVINDVGIEYDNGSRRGEAEFSNGNPVISFNIDNVVNYNKHFESGTNYLVLHEVGHLTSANRAYDMLVNISQSLVEQMANDIASAIAYESSLDILPASSEIMYSSGTPLVFGVDEGSGGGTGGGGGWWTDQPI